MKKLSSTPNTCQVYYYYEMIEVDEDVLNELLREYSSALAYIAEQKYEYDLKGAYLLLTKHVRDFCQDLGVSWSDDLLQDNILAIMIENHNI